MSGLELLKTTYGDLPRDVRCLATSQITRWHDIRKLFAAYADSPKLEELYQCILKIDPDDDIVNSNYWLTVETLTRFKNVEVVNNLLYIFDDIHISDYFDQFSIMLEQLPKLRELTIMVNLENLIVEQYTHLLVNIIDLFFQSVIRRSQGRLTVLINHQLISLLDTRRPETAINNGQLDYDDKLYFLRQNHLYWELDRGRNKYSGDLEIGPLRELVPVFNNYQLPTIVSETEPLKFEEIHIFIPSMNTSKYMNNLANYRSSNNMTGKSIMINSTTRIKKLVVNYFPLLSQSYIFIKKIRNPMRMDNIIRDYLGWFPSVEEIVSSNPPFVSRSGPEKFHQLINPMSEVSEDLITKIPIYPQIINFNHVISHKNTEHAAITFPNLQSIYLIEETYISAEPKFSPSIDNIVKNLIKNIKILLERSQFKLATVLLTNPMIAIRLASSFRDESRVKIVIIK